MIFSGEEIVAELEQLGITHVIWIPDSDLGRWESALEKSMLSLIRVCREGEAWPLAAGLIIGGKSPVVIIQSTGLFESGDALRNVVHDMRIPVFSIVGARNWLNANSHDSAKRFVMPIVDAWDIDYQLIESRSERAKLKQHYDTCCASSRAGMIVLAE
ncbi:MAG: hypothetical protein KDB22_21020 [Planctomycetales bacterium]|nr:hypothetical protein [Planctomycetales bacterium]